MAANMIQIYCTGTCIMISSEVGQELKAGVPYLPSLPLVPGTLLQPHLKRSILQESRHTML